MQAYEHAPAAVNADHDRQALEAVSELRADWLADRPEHCCCPAAKADPCLSCSAYGPPPSDFTIIDIDDLHEGPYSSPLFDVVALPGREEAEEEFAAHLAGREPVADYDGDGDDYDRWAAEAMASDRAFAEHFSEARLPFSAWVQAQADRYRAVDTGACQWLAGKIDELAAEARYLDAKSAEQFEDRHDARADAATCR